MAIHPAGKTTLADVPADMVQSTLLWPLVRASIDDFHRSGHKFRSMRGEWTAQSYYDESYDHLAFRDLVLRPLGPNGNRCVRTAMFDSYHDAPIPALASRIRKGNSHCGPPVYARCGLA